MSSQRRLRAVALTFLGVLVASGCGAGTGGTTYLSIGTAGTGGVYYPLGGALASILSSRDSTRTYTAEVSGGSVENVNRLMSRQMDMAFVIGTTIYEAYTGGQDFPEPVTDIRVIAPLYAQPTHVLVSTRSGVNSVADLRGRRVSIGAAGSGNEQLARHTLEAYGLGPGDIEPRYLTFTESSAALRDGAIAAAIMTVGYPASAVLEATTMGDAKLISVDGPPLQHLLDNYPYYMPYTIPAGVYRGMDQDVPTFAVMNWIIARSDLDDEIVTLVLDVLERERDRLVQVNEIARQIDLDALDRAPIPLHDATRRWLEQRRRQIAGP